MFSCLVQSLPVFHIIQLLSALIHIYKLKSYREGVYLLTFSAIPYQIILVPKLKLFLIILLPHFFFTIIRTNCEEQPTTDHGFMD